LELAGVGIIKIYMKISVRQATKVRIRFEGKVNMSQEVVLDKKDAQKLGEILVNKKQSFFKTKQ
jgi:hypothetical protein